MAIYHASGLPAITFGLTPLAAVGLSCDMYWALGRVAGEWVNAALSFVYPEWCQICINGRATPAQGFVCDNCRSSVRLVEPPHCERCGRPYEGQISQAFTCHHCMEMPPSFAYARSAALAQDVVLEAIHRYKYNRALFIEPFLAELFLRKAAPSLSKADWDVMIPVPLHPRKQRQREFNQAERIARHLSQATEIPLDSNILRRVTPTRTQTQLTREQRFENVQGAFQIRKGATARGLRIVVVDDVFTTGATTNACAGTLLADGATAVCVWTVARGT